MPDDDKQKKLEELLKYVGEKVDYVEGSGTGTLTQIAHGVAAKGTWEAPFANDQAASTVTDVNDLMDSFDSLSERIAGAMSPAGTYTAADRAALLEGGDGTVDGSSRVVMSEDKLKKAIGKIEALSARADDARKQISNESTSLGDPVSVDNELATILSRISDLNRRADSITNCKDAIVALNENGIAHNDTSGNLVYELPEGVEKVDQLYLESAAKLAARAVSDAKNLQYAEEHGTDKHGRTPDEILASMEDNQDEANYAAAFVSVYGVENMLDAPVGGVPGKDKYLGDSGTYVNRFGHLFAAASRHYDSPDTSVTASVPGPVRASLVDDIIAALEEEGHDGRASVLAAMMNNSSMDELYAERAAAGQEVYSSDFLVDLAIKAEAITDWKEAVSRRAGDAGATGTYMTCPDGSPLYGGGNYSCDPLAAVLGGMEYSPQASLDYFTPTNPAGGVDVSKIEQLSKRDWHGQGLGNFAGALAAGTALRVSPDAATARRASMLAGYSLTHLHNNTLEEDYTAETKQSVALILGNCAPEVTSAWSDISSVDDPEYKGTDDSLPGVEAGTITRMAYRMADDSDAVATLSARLGAYAKECSERQVAEDTNADHGLGDIRNVYKRGARAAGALAALTERKAEARNEQGDEQANVAYSAFSAGASAALGLVATGPAGAVVGGGASVGTALLQPIVIDQVPELKNARESVAGGSTLFAGAAQEYADAGLIEQETLREHAERYSWIKPVGQDEDGQPTYALDLEGLTSKELEEVAEWETRVQMDKGFNQDLNDMRGEIDGAWTSGHEAMESTAASFK